MREKKTEGLQYQEALFRTSCLKKAVFRDSCLVFRDPKTLAGGTAVAPQQPGLGKAVIRKKFVIRVSCLVKTIGGKLVRSRRNVWRPVNPNLHFSPPDGRSTRYEHQGFVALACRAQRTVQVRLRAPSGSRLVLAPLSRTSPRRVVRNAG